MSATAYDVNDTHWKYVDPTALIYIPPFHPEYHSQSKEQDFWRCVYCGRDNDLPVLDCRSCGAPRNRSREP